MCGEVKSKEKEKTASTPLVTVSDLQRLSKFEIIVLRRRMFPYKTRFQTDFEVDWGRTYPKAVPPIREKREVQLFDIREFVKEKKKEKMEAMGTNPFTGNSPFAGSSPFGASPFGGANPFMGMGSPMTGMPFMNDDNNDSDDGGFNIDDLVKKIDAKIAEIEKEEEETKKLNENEEVPIPEPVKAEDKSNVIDVEETSDTSSDINNESKDIEEPLKNMYENNTNDNDFFDDFFSDD